MTLVHVDVDSPVNTMAKDHPTSVATPLPEASGSVLSTPSKMSAGKPAIQTRQKRVLPSRSRRGGPGVGSCDVDIMILETLKRKHEAEPLIPATTPFLLTTNSSLVPESSASSSSFELNSQAYGRYFDRPEVRKAYKAQQLIQTPEFTQISDDIIVGGRFRPREAEDEAADTSDAAYEKRHRKYETFEKRQRLREKEKLKHEQYKLKERIEQLRAMDASAFLTLPASDFPDLTEEGTPRSHDHHPTKVEAHDPGIDAASSHHEGERRRKEMLDVALSLEERYRVLLPVDRKWLDKKTRPPESISTAASFRPESEEPSEEEEESSEAEDSPAKPSPRPREDDGESEVDFEERERQRSKGLKLRIKFPPRLNPATTTPASSVKQPPSKYKQKTLSPFMTKQQAKADALVLSPSLQSAVSKGRGITDIPGVVIRSSDGKFLPKSKRYAADTDDPSPGTPPSKRQRGHHSSFLTPGESISAGRSSKHSPKSHTSERAPCLLVLSAERNAAAPAARKTQRHVTAFGARVPPEIEEVRDFEIPAWVLQSTSYDGEESEDWRTSMTADVPESASGDPHASYEDDFRFDLEYPDDRDDEDVKDGLILDDASVDSIHDGASKDNPLYET